MWKVKVFGQNWKCETASYLCMGSLVTGVIILSKTLSLKIQLHSQLLHSPWYHSWKGVICILLKLS